MGAGAGTATIPSNRAPTEDSEKTLHECKARRKHTPVLGQVATRVRTRCGKRAPALGAFCGSLEKIQVPPTSRTLAIDEGYVAH